MLRISFANAWLVDLPRFHRGHRAIVRKRKLLSEVFLEERMGVLFAHVAVASQAKMPENVLLGAAIRSWKRSTSSLLKTSSGPQWAVGILVLS